MQIPRRLAYILERDQALDGAVKLSVSQFEPWIKHSNLPFFPEYTKHDIEHIEAVLRTATGLIRDDAWEAITPSDAAVLILSVLLHDCAMHLSEDGFVSLMEESRREKSVKGMSDKPWHILWEEFFGEASRFDGRKLTQIFGDTQPVRRPPSDPNELTKKDRLLVGEFLRRHHPRLAQEIVFFGVPTQGDIPLVLQGLSGAAQHIASLSGIVARSHGANVRAFLPYLQDQFDIRQYKGVHPVYLMTLLRVADYIQLEAERAPAQVLHIKRLASPVSQGEWAAHHAILDIRHTHEDPEALFIDAFPEDVKTFFRVKAWLNGIQQELDASWAVLGEVYGRYEGLNRLGLALRRVRSSIDNVAAFAKRVTYLPVKAVFRGSSADLLKLLIEPLYGNRPEVGLRELIQNAVDAVRELEQYRKDVPAMSDLTQLAQDSDVVAALEKGKDGEAWVVISDRGIGMNPEVIVDYFLTAGASFRRSEDWRKIFESTEGKSKILRAGRFGVGALASFLIGPEIEVSTRHADELEGIRFNASVDSDTIELRRIKRPVGTTIRIRTTTALAERLAKPKQRNHYRDQDDRIDWDWYCLSKPSVSRIAFGTKLEQEHNLPDVGSILGAQWRRISHPDYAEIMWSYSNVPAVVCNGIIIQGEKRQNQPLLEESWTQRFGLQLPNISVFDPDGHFPLNLQRTGLAESRYPFDDVLASDVIRDFIAFSLVFGPDKFQARQNGRAFRYPGSSKRALDRGYGECGDYYFTPSGFGYCDPFILSSEQFKTMLISRLETKDNDTMKLLQCDNAAIIPHDGLNIGDCLEWVRAMLECSYYPEHNIWAYWGQKTETAAWGAEQTLNSMKRKGSRVILSQWLWEKITTQSRKLPKTLQKAASLEWAVDNWRLLKIGDCPKPTFDFLEFAKKNDATNDRSVITEVYIGSGKKTEPSTVAAKWMQILQNAEIPYDPKVRRQKLKHAFDELSIYVQAHESTMKQQLKTV